MNLYFPIYPIETMTPRKKSAAKKTFCVWADYVRRVYQHVDAANPKHAYDIAKNQPDCWEPCDWHDNIGYRLSNEVQDLATEEFIAVRGAKNCRTCGSEIMDTINNSNFRKGECGACEYVRYQSQPALLDECRIQLGNWQMLLSHEWDGSTPGILCAIERLETVIHQADGKEL